MSLMMPTQLTMICVLLLVVSQEENLLIVIYSQKLFLLQLMIYSTKQFIALIMRYLQGLRLLFGFFKQDLNSLSEKFHES